MRQALLILLTLSCPAFGGQNPAPESPRDVRMDTREFAIMVPNGWKLADPGLPEINLIHTSGAVFLFRRPGYRKGQSLDTLARQGADAVMRPLGFATIGEPLRRKVNGFPAIQYEVRGNRLSERRRLLYIAFEGDDDIYEIVYENSESGFDLLLPEAERMGASVERIAVANERIAVAQIRSANTAEFAYRAAHGRFGSMGELVGDNLLAANFPNAAYGYRIIVTAEGSGYRIDAMPGSGPGRWGYESDQTGIVRYSSRRGMAPSGMLGRPVQ